MHSFPDTFKRQMETWWDICRYGFCGLCAILRLTATLLIGIMTGMTHFGQGLWMFIRLDLTTDSLRSLIKIDCKESKEASSDKTVSAKSLDTLACKQLRRLLWKNVYLVTFTQMIILLSLNCLFDKVIVKMVLKLWDSALKHSTSAADESRSTINYHNFVHCIKHSFTFTLTLASLVTTNMLRVRHVRAIVWFGRDSCSASHSKPHTLSSYWNENSQRKSFKQALIEMGMSELLSFIMPLLMIVGFTMFKSGGVLFVIFKYAALSEAYSFLTFNQVWKMEAVESASHNPSILKKCDFVDSRWIYFVGFGLPLTLLNQQMSRMLIGYSSNNLFLTNLSFVTLFPVMAMSSTLISASPSHRDYIHHCNVEQNKCFRLPLFSTFLAISTCAACAVLWVFTNIWPFPMLSRFRCVDMKNQMSNTGHCSIQMDRNFTCFMNTSEHSEIEQLFDDISSSCYSNVDEQERLIRTVQLFDNNVTSKGFEHGLLIVDINRAESSEISPLFDISSSSGE